MYKAAVTGIGLVTPLGFGRERTWSELLNGSSVPETYSDSIKVLCARVKNLNVPDQVRLVSMAFLAASEAVKDSNPQTSSHARFGCTVSVSKPDISLLTPQASFTQVNNAFMEQFTHSSLGHQLHRVFRLNGPVKNVSAACATGSASLILASKWIEEGVCDMVLAGACESSLYPLYVAGFDNMGVLAKERVCPFSLDRQGFAVGEGAGIFVLERKDKAMMRGANIYAEIAGCSMANDARGAVNSDPGGLAISEAIIKSMNKSGFQEIDYINAHGTGTRLNDLIETKAIKKAFSGKEGRISVSSTKAATGHLLGASGAVEAAFCMLSLRDQVVPATLNLLNRDPECDLDYTPNSAKRRLVRSAMSLSFGFGGQITSIVAGR